MTSTSFAPAALFQSLWTHWSQHDRLLRLHTPLDAVYGPDTLIPEALQAVEEIGPENWQAAPGNEGSAGICGYRIELTALSLEAHLDLRQLLGQPVLLQLLIAQSRTELRPFHGHVTCCACIGANGGFARYRLVIEPWLAFAAYRSDSALYQDKTVCEIVESVFADYQAQGKLAPAWRIDLADPSIYSRRSLTTQYQETDLAFLGRLLLEEGLFAWFEHHGDLASETLGRHTLVIADHNGAFSPNRQSRIRFTQPGAVMPDDSIDRWRMVRRWQTNAIELASWDYRSHRTSEAAAFEAAEGANALTLGLQDAPGVYAYESQAQGQRLAERQLEALTARRERILAAGTVRTAASGTTFTLDDHASFEAIERLGNDDPRTFLMLRVVHEARNNLTAALQHQTHHAFGDVAHCWQTRLDGSAAQSEPGEAASFWAASSSSTRDDQPLYRNRIDAQPAATAYRAAGIDEHGIVLHPKPTVGGQQTAIVVGPAQGGPVHTDRDHRIQVQFHWQRGTGSHSRLAHPAPEGHTGASATAATGTWVRVATSLAGIAGANWGSHAVPRVGQEVLIDFLEGDIDRPVVIGSLYNGRGHDDAAHNQVAQGAGAATGNAPAWFPGQHGAHAHAAVFSGIKSQALSASQSGTGAASALVFDDTPHQPRVSLQHHAQPHAGTAQLHLGALRHQSDNERHAPTGFGLELATEHSTALRAAQGLLLSTEAQPDARGAQLASQSAQTQLAQGIDLLVALAETARQHQASLPGDPQAAALPAIAQLQASLATLQATAQGTTDNPGQGGAGLAPAFDRPQLQASAPAGIVATTPASAVLAAGQQISLTAGHAIHIAAQGNLHHLVKDGIAWFANGQASAPTIPNQETGMRLHAASGKVSSQSQSGKTALTADGLITVASTTQDVTIAAPEQVLLTAQGAAIRIAGGNIELHAPGRVMFRSSAAEWAGAQTTSISLFEMPKSLPLEGNYSTQFVVKNSSGKIMPNYYYRMESDDGHSYEGITDKEGKTVRFYTEKIVKFKLSTFTKNIDSLKDVHTPQRSERFNERH